MPSRSPSITLGRFPKGMTNLGSPEGLPEGSCRNGVNVDFLDNGQPRRRAGNSLVYPGADCDSAWSNQRINLFREGTALKQLKRSSAGVYTATTLRSGLAAATPITFLDVNGDVYYTNSAITGKLTAEDGGRVYTDGPWGVERPARQPVATALGYGGMHPGTYQVAITFRSASGEEGGTGVAATAIVASGEGIALTDIPQPTAASHIRVYASMADGDVLYYQGEYPAGTAGITVSAFQSDVRLETQFGHPPLPGTALCHHNGRIYIAEGPVVWRTEALRYGLFRPDWGFLPMFPEDVRVLASVADGLYVATEAATYFDSGIDTDGFGRRMVLPYGAAAGTVVKVPKTQLVAWFSHRGWVLAGPGGQIKNAMEDRNAVSKFRAGAGLFRETNGVRQLVACLRDGEASGLMAKDYVDFETARRGSAV
jgi:hypothetical protein